MLCVPSDLTFDGFHAVLQKAFGWSDIHPHAFHVNELRKSGHPLLPGGSSRKMLTLGTTGASTAEDIFTLADIYDKDGLKDDISMTYEYDFGDGWEHDIRFLGKADPAMKRSMRVPECVRIFCISGEGHPCAENCGGTFGWMALKEAFKKRGDPEGKKRWYKRVCHNGDRRGLDPYKFDVVELNHELVGLTGGFLLPIMQYL